MKKQAARARAAAARGQAWVDSRDPASKTGVAIGAWQRYRAVEGPLQSALLSLYILVAVVPSGYDRSFELRVGFAQPAGKQAHREAAPHRPSATRPALLRG
jgi:hypothetical protein